MNIHMTQPMTQPWHGKRKADIRVLPKMMKTRVLTFYIICDLHILQMPGSKPAFGAISDLHDKEALHCLEIQVGKVNKSSTCAY